MSSVTPARDPVSEPVAALIDVFGAHSAALCFPEVDHAILEGLAAELRQAAAEVERQERALHQARQVLDERRDALRARAERGLAYARIFAEDDEPLREQLEAIDLGSTAQPAAKRTTKRHPPRRRKGTKPAVADETVEELRFVPGQPAAIQVGAA
jgi:signal transduction protein with GAF and PtsI domain